MERANMHNSTPEFPTRIDTPRLYLRGYRPGDGRWYYPMSLRNREHLARYEGHNPATRLDSEQEAEFLLRGFASDWTARAHYFLGTFRRETDEFVAQIYVGPTQRELPEFQIGYFADCQHEGQGYVTEAVRAVMRVLFQELGVHRVRLECDDTNVRSYRVAERCGLLREGHFRENKRHADGSLSGTLVYGLLRGEYAG
jgi:aminoglycoside 6'-N-acetyltransferase